MIVVLSSLKLILDKYNIILYLGGPASAMLEEKRNLRVASREKKLKKLGEKKPSNIAQWRESISIAKRKLDAEKELAQIIRENRAIADNFLNQINGESETNKKWFVYKTDDREFAILVSKNAKLDQLGLANTLQRVFPNDMKATFIGGRSGDINIDSLCSIFYYYRN